MKWLAYSTLLVINVSVSDNSTNRISGLSLIMTKPQMYQANCTVLGPAHSPSSMYKSYTALVAAFQPEQDFPCALGHAGIFLCNGGRFLQPRLAVFLLVTATCSTMAHRDVPERTKSTSQLFVVLCLQDWETGAVHVVISA